MFVDRYKILGIAQNATLDEITQAYRLAAMRCHPDRGGSHEAMIAVNEAFFILSDPAKRAEYDRVWAQIKSAGSQVAVHVAEEWSRQTQDVWQKAAEYPREWAAFEQWMKGLVSDVKAAKYGATKSVGGHLGWIVFPTVKGSASGCLFILVLNQAIAELVGGGFFGGRVGRHR